jgi:hypothetical protein
VFVSLLHCSMSNNVRRVEWASPQRFLPKVWRINRSPQLSRGAARVKKLARTLGTRTGIMARKQQKKHRNALLTSVHRLVLTFYPLSLSSLLWPSHRKVMPPLGLACARSRGAHWLHHCGAAAWARRRSEARGSSPLHKPRIPPRCTEVCASSRSH